MPAEAIPAKEQKHEQHSEAHQIYRKANEAKKALHQTVPGIVS